MTAVACSLVDTLAALDRWAEHNFPQLDAARALYDARQLRQSAGSGE
ncbi:hypothetical protein [Pseudomonas chlororaphis]